MDKLINDFSFGLFFWVAIIFVILIVLMRKFAWKPILEALNEREEGISNALEAAENAKKELQALNADNERILKEARAERDTMLKEAREIKDKIVADAKQEANEQSATIISNAKQAIEVEKQAALAELKSQIAGISISIAKKVIKSELASEKSQLELVEKSLKEVTLN
ncbi:F-type H+-transporting ATPase subunit b [Wenyingzhuangia heitensis]|uniref:ATP synthase subunit b n=1 Tax=Wenyingzhuangia heitensis TaxID=1487859 RepID=A0ABX0UA54_9FLAO|nr:F0F1 ATP synthase subunit B [Wenyingzhuangia heitensis]NIJ44041.1 F-type H+-transporting ATPase subunit b [Wenyingzhuangia heitensis]